MGVPVQTSRRGIFVRWKLIVPALLCLYLLHIIESHKHLFVYHAHTVSALTISFTSTFVPREPLPPPVADSFCSTHNFPAWPHSRRRRIYDLFLLNTELDWLEIRLNTLSSSVDYFVIIESAFTFTGHPKPLLLKENWARFERFHGQIIHHVLTELPVDAKKKWDIEIYQRNAMFSQVFPHLEGRKRARRGDVLVVSDLDEIPRPGTMVLLRNCDIPKRVTLRSQFYYYSFQWLHRGPQWAHGQATVFGGVGDGKTILPHDLRGGRGEWNILNTWWESTNIWNAGWHCSTCFETVEEVLTKMGSFSHTEYNKIEFRDKTRILDRIRNGKDLWDRPGQNYDKVEDNEDIPEYLKKNRTRWEYLLNRDGENAGFTDVK